MGWILLRPIKNYSDKVISNYTVGNISVNERRVGPSKCNFFLGLHASTLGEKNVLGLQFKSGTKCLNSEIKDDD